MVRLETERLYIRDHVIEDLDSHHELISNEEVMYYIQDIQTHAYEASRDNLLFSIEEAKKENRKCYFFGIFLRESDEHVGSIGFTVLEEGDSGNAEMGYFIHKRFWHRGYTYEASQAVVKYAFDIGMQKITTGCVYLNTRSENIMKKLGMYKEGHLYKHTYIGGKWLDRVTYGLYNKSYLSKEDHYRLLYVSLAKLLGNIPYHFMGYQVESNEIHLEVLDTFRDRLEEVFSGYQEKSRRDKTLTFEVDQYDLCCSFVHEEIDFYHEEEIKLVHYIPIRFKQLGDHVIL